MNAPSSRAVVPAHNAAPWARHQASSAPACLGLICGVVTLAQAYPVFAYGNDTHYGLTYFVACTAGYTPLQAQRLASACAAPDNKQNTDTEPVELDDPVNEVVQGRRVHFHALLDERKYPNFASDRAQYRGGLQERDQVGQTLLQYTSRTMTNPGVALHFLQDRYTHWGYGSKWGHFNPVDLLWPNRLPFGSRTDFLSFEPHLEIPRIAAERGIPRDRNWAMVQETYRVLTQFLPAQAKTIPAAVALGQCRDVLHTLQKASPVPAPNKYTQEPNMAAAYRAINSKLAQYGYTGRVSSPTFYPLRTNEASTLAVNDSLRRTMALTADATFILPSKGWQTIQIEVAGNGKGTSPVILARAKAPLSGNALLVRACPVGEVTVKLFKQANTHSVSAVKFHAAQDKISIAPPPGA